eukprot:gnl/Hemi2/11638_TR4005_c0_g1_i1.p1 gnl/Hemi2/11638_TR4005_c0_g1~~gnl/Hemi2/11638_TR4005_c0_g1_i1.p1  ORF type:complete len:149 (+),score=51.57 gnl/Hemi2/11638_TR4005_c0_g1_i1:126-572(+)
MAVPAVAAGLKAIQASAGVTGLTVRASSIAGAGLGVFAERDFPAGQVVAVYMGHLLSEQEIEEALSSTDDHAFSYTMYLAEGVWIDAETIPSNVARYINDHRDASRLNCAFIKKPQLLLAEVATLRDIRVGEELFVSYGPHYWAQPLA